jgi:hypothetical protein
VREAASRVQCQNNLKQLGLALHNFHDTFKGFPPAVQALPVYPPFTAANPPQLSWGPYILPYIEQGNLQNAYNMKKDWTDPVNDGKPPYAHGNGAGPNQTELKLMVCPSAPPQGERGTGNNRAVTDYAPANQIYRNSAGVNPFLTFTPPSDPTFLGIMGHNVNRRATDVVDGLSNTILLAEDAGRNMWWIMGKHYGTKPVNFTIGGETGPWANPGSDIKITGFNPPNLGTKNPLTPGPCAVNCTNGDEIYSFHMGIANVAMGDGSVRQLKASTDINIIVALITRKGREVIPADALQ